MIGKVQSLICIILTIKDTPFEIYFNRKESVYFEHGIIIWLYDLII